MVNYWGPNGYANWQNQGYGGYGYRQNEYRRQTGNILDIDLD